MMKSEGKIGQLIINSPYREPEAHWRYDQDGQTFVKEAGRRPAGYLIAERDDRAREGAGRSVELPLVNAIRPRVREWREAKWPGATGTTKALLDHWRDGEARRWPFFFCQLDAIETLIWLVEAPASAWTGIDIPGDGGPFPRVCTKLCTGGGKTIVMAMLIAWMACNRAAYPRDRRFAKDFLVVAPNLTVKDRLEVLRPGPGSYHEQFSVVPDRMGDLLRRARVRILNWQALTWEGAEALAKHRSVDKRGPKSDVAYAREVLGEMADAHRIAIINDEAHHAWRLPPGTRERRTKEEKDAEREATVWVGGLDRIARARGILGCWDFSATPFAPGARRSDEEALFPWIVSDFGLNDGIEAGLVKTPRVVVRDDAVPDAATFKSKLYHLYADETVKANIERAEPPETPLPDLLTQAYTLLGKDWQALYEDWRGKGAATPPVMITVANRTETAARIKYAFDHRRIDVPELCEDGYILHIDSKELEREDAPEALRKKVDTVGRPGMTGEQIRNVISVGMLTEGWDARTVTHIMGLRAFASQLLCEQVVGRGLRRTSYDVDEETGLFAPEYVNIFGIPFTFLPHEEDGEIRPVPPKTLMEVRRDRPELEIRWPNVVRIERVMRRDLTLDVDAVPLLSLDAASTRLSAELAPIVAGQTDLGKLSEIDLEGLEPGLRMQRAIFAASARVWEMKGTRDWPIGQVFRIVEEWLRGGRISIEPRLFETSPLRRRLVLMLNMDRIVQHLWGQIQSTLTEALVPVLDASRRSRSTADMPTWWTGRPCAPTRRSHISHCVYDSAWEAAEAYALERSPHVAAWAKNDHLGFEIFYTFGGIVRRYRPDFLIRLTNGRTLILETKGQEGEQERAKRAALAEWAKAVNGLTEFGEWRCDVSRDVADVEGIIERHMGG